jgi:hypothetical protein
MASLILHPNFGRPGQAPLRAYSPGDDFYEQLVEVHRGLSDEASELLNARLVLLLANHIGDLDVLGQALSAARSGGVDPTGAAPAAGAPAQPTADAATRSVAAAPSA